MPKLALRNTNNGANKKTRQDVSPQPLAMTDKSLGKPTIQLKPELFTQPSNCIFANKRSSEYFDSLQVPTHEHFLRISAAQKCKELEIMNRITGEKLISHNQQSKFPSESSPNEEKLSEARATYDLSMSPTDRWVEAAREVYYRKLTWPYEPKDLNRLLGKTNRECVSNDTHVDDRSSTWRARHNWKKVGLIVRRAGRDEDPCSGTLIKGLENNSGKECIHMCITRQSTKEELRRKAKMMDLQYFLEMVDPKHRYGPNLRIYHEEWKKIASRDNFFYWLDYGEGLQISCQACSRERLERERVRYLSKEERSNYLVAMDRNGRLCWAKNGNLVDTSLKFCDSINGIVPVTDIALRNLATTAELPQEALKYEDKNFFVNSSSLNSYLKKSFKEYKNNSKYSNTTTYATTKLTRSSNTKIIRHISLATIIDRLLRGSVKKNTWIFVADTNFRLYIGMKQSGIFQHSSFLHGSRISAAGSIKVIDGKLSELSPLSGHYRPPVANFRAFIRALKETGVDTSQASISRSYFILIGLETYIKTRHMTKKFFDQLVKMQGDSIKPQVH